MPHVFRDKTELGASGDLPTSITRALGQSRVLIILCSPAAAASPWVAQEILEFKKLGRLDPIVAVLIDGEPNSKLPSRECYPEPLRYHLHPDHSLNFDKKAEPIWVDFRGPEGTQGAISPELYEQRLRESDEFSEAKISRCVTAYKFKFQDSRIRLLAGVLGLPHREIDDYEKFRMSVITGTDPGTTPTPDALSGAANRKSMLYGFAMGVALLLLVIIAGLLYIREVRALHQGTGPSLAAVTPPTYPTTLPTAAPPQTPALSVAPELAETKETLPPTSPDAAPDGWVEAHKAANDTFAAGDYAASAPHWEKVVTIAEKQLALFPNHQPWRIHVLGGNQRWGECLTTLNRPLEAIPKFQKAIAQITEDLSAQATKHTHAILLMDLAGAQQLADRLPEAEITMGESLRLINEAYEMGSNVDGMPYARHLVWAAAARLNIEIHKKAKAAGQTENQHLLTAITQLQECTKLLEEILPDTKSYPAAPVWLTMARESLADYSEMAGQTPTVITALRDNIAHLTIQVAANPTAFYYHIALARHQARLAKILLDSTDQAAKTEVQDLRASADSLLKSLPADQPLKAEYNAAKALIDALPSA